MLYCRRILCLTLIVAFMLTLVPYGMAEDYRLQVNYQHVTLDINRTGDVAMKYEIDSTIVKGNWTEVWVPATTEDMDVYYIEDGNGVKHDFRIEYDGQARQIKVLGFDLAPGDHVNLKIYSTLPGFIYKSDREGYAIVTFIPAWWDMQVKDTRVKFYLPAEVNRSEIYTGARQYDNIMVEEGRTVIYFEDMDLAPNERFEVAVSFPEKYLDTGAVHDKTGSQVPIGTGTGYISDGFFCIGPFMLFFVFIVVVSILAALNRKPYTSPVVSMDGIGVNKSLDPAEAATLLRIDPRRVLTMIMFGLMKKGNVKLISTDPIRLELVSRQNLNYYEKLFADSIKDSRPDEDGMLECFKVLARRVVDKTRPYCRKDTEDYYHSKIESAWAEIKAVDTPELKLEKYDTNMMWLMADEQFTERTREYISRAPGSDTSHVPHYYWWYPYYFWLPHYYGTSQTAGQEQPGTPSTNSTTASVESFANSISDSVESFSAGIITGVEKFLGVRNEANALPVARGFAPSPSYYSNKSSCACVSCACACVSCACACACAGGGGGCT